jgi:hypothetical protein
VHAIRRQIVIDLGTSACCAAKLTSYQDRVKSPMAGFGARTDRLGSDQRIQDEACRHADPPPKPDWK